MAISENTIIQLAVAAASRVNTLVSDKEELSENMKAPSTFLGSASLLATGGISIESHSAIGGFETLEQQVLHLLFGIAEAVAAVSSLYFAFKKPNKKKGL